MRIALMSDLHGNLPTVWGVPELLVLAGDICPDYSDWRRAPELQAAWLANEFHEWLEEHGIPTVMTWGNHDWVGQTDKVPKLPAVVLRDELTEVSLSGQKLRVWGCPWAKWCGGWAFMATEDQFEARLAGVPEGLDILMVHGPPYGYGDEVAEGEHVGSHALLHCIDRKQPRLVVCGHIHEAYGSYTLEGPGPVPIKNVSIVDERYIVRRGATIVEMDVGAEVT